MSPDSSMLRAVRLVRQTVERLALDLRGLTVLTEAATGHFAVTPAIALAAGATRVIAVARDSAYGTAAESEGESRRLASALDGAGSLEVVRGLDADSVQACDVITNLGAVRPIDARVVSWMKPTAVVSLMCESWEFRPGDVDAEACRQGGIIVLGTNEHDPSFPIFSYCGPLAIRLLLDAGFELQGTKVAVLGRDRFAPVVADALARAGATVWRAEGLSHDGILGAVHDADAIFLADYASDDLILGDGGLVTGEELAGVAAGATVIQLAGGLDEASLRRNGLVVWPTPAVPPRRMSRTLAALGVRPVIELHAAGLAVGALGARARLGGASPAEAVKLTLERSSLAQPLVA